MKKHLSLALATIMLSLALTGCGNKVASETTTVTQNNQQETTTEPQIGLTNFSAQDMNGNTVTQDILADYDLTMVNIWATWCGYCIEEMPELQKLYESLPENVNLITIGTDAEQNKDLAADILKQSNTTFTTLIGNESLEESLTRYVSGLPSTVFVDNKGNFVGQGISGIPTRGDEIAQAYLNIITDTLESMGE